jgi:hypothetical protein
MGIFDRYDGTHINEARPEATEIRWHLNPSAATGQPRRSGPKLREVETVDEQHRAQDDDRTNGAGFRPAQWQRGR